MQVFSEAVAHPSTSHIITQNVKISKTQHPHNLLKNKSLLFLKEFNNGPLMHQSLFHANKKATFTPFVSYLKVLTFKI
jgi:hypothetical protein